MEIVPLFGEQIITADNIEVRVNPKDRERAEALVNRTRNDVQDVRNPDEFDSARQAAGQLKAMLDEIENARKANKQAFDAVGRAIQDLASNVARPVKTEQERILSMLNKYVAKLEAARKEEERIQAEARRIAQEKADRKVREAQEAARRAQAELRAAQDEIERAKLQEAAQRRENQLLQQQLAAELALDVEELGKNNEPPRGLVPDGRVDHVFDFALESVQQTVAAGQWRLLKWTLDIRACQDMVKAQLETGVVEPSLPGIRITKRLRVSVKSAARIK